ncbi:hypothetical protein [Endozoicomonas atrinae]|uniref:hypothetical protein n=1 Tax=Endozoicomonas atrinae TaxID=1333660 RepID=UPI000AEDFB63|nr:hypothetical protein [Endozoicomonas atrinae]
MNDQQKKEYIANRGRYCPYCGSSELSVIAGDYHSTGQYYNAECDDCHKKWCEVYTLTDVEVDEE